MEFGGPIGVTALMIWSHYILIYFWYCLETNEGKMVIPGSIDALMNHISNLGTLFVEKGTPSTTMWCAYFIFFFAQIAFAAVVPGLTMHGLPTAPNGVRLPYHCNGYLCYYLCLACMFTADYYGIFPLTYLADNFGEALIASIIIADVTTVYWYIYGLLFADEFNGKASRTGNIPYDFFMGTILYPRIGEIDVKMIAECRWSWLTLFLLTLSCAVKQYRTLGFLSPNMALMLLAHWLYSNATVKGEHCIPCTWDMFHENFGWMLNFWNICGVPFLYCFQSYYILYNYDKIAATYPAWLNYLNFVVLLVGYYIFDTANCQKATIKIRLTRNTFPQLPWAILQDPIPYIKTPMGNLLVGGWYGFVRKLQYTGDILMALSWGLATGFGSSLPYFYLLFFTCMIVHRQTRDEVRCSAKYGVYWKKYTDLVPNVFLPPLSFYTWLLTGKHPLDGVKLD
ncbi:ergosterol biosynthesis ERG4/ERG24 [Ochromonadaceae sp. CCMP2298]|nr:ergosterol biosynthesis ERG4/ERG24 [Ochromonadaceae sp. CCMP2298]